MSVTVECMGFKLFRAVVAAKEATTKTSDNIKYYRDEISQIVLWYHDICACALLRLLVVFLKRRHGVYACTAASALVVDTPARPIWGYFVL